MMRIFILLGCASVVLAQEWQWELVSPEWRNPTGFPDDVIAAGDFDGDGLTELLAPWGEGWGIWSRDTTSQTMHWIMAPSDFPEGVSFDGVTVQNMDEDDAWEIVLFEGFSGTPPTCLKMTSARPWEWEWRNDLLDGLVPESTSPMLRRAVWSDFDGDGLEECVAIAEVVDPHAVHLLHFERSEAGAWSEPVTIAVPWELLPFEDRLQIGDLDQDDDVDIVVTTGAYDAPPITMLVENYLDGLTAHDLVSMQSCDVMGELDDDDYWELIASPDCSGENITFYSIRNFDSLMSDGGIARLNGRIFGNLQTIRGFETVAANHVYCPGNMGWFPPSMMTYLRTFNGDSWWSSQWYNDYMWCLSLGDVDNDGLRDMLRGWEYVDSQWNPQSGLTLSLNVGNPTRDLFDVLHFNIITPEYSFLRSSPPPSLGDVNGDGMAELWAMHTESVPTPVRRLTVFRIEQLVPEEIFTIAEELMSGLPDTVSSFICPDLDGDGAVELLATVDGAQHLYFFRNGMWVEYEGILPEGMGAVQGFADWNGDGTNDLFTNEGVWLNLTPSIAREPEIVPREFEMSVYPNPFNSTATLQFDLPHAGRVHARLFDVLGREIVTLVDERLAAGRHQFAIDAAQWASGVYFANVKTEIGEKTEKVLLIR